MEDGILRMLTGMLKESEAGYITTKLGDVTLILTADDETAKAMLDAVKEENE